MIKGAIFDLDGTLLPMDQDEFTKIYISDSPLYIVIYNIYSIGKKIQ